MTDEHPLDELAVYARDALDDDERQMVEAHLARCPSCRAVVDEHWSTLAALGAPDVPTYPARRGGAVVSGTITRYAYASLQVRDGRSARIESVDLGQTVEVEDEKGLEFDGTIDLAKAVIRRVAREAVLENRTSLLLHTDAPPGSGLGSSSAAIVAMLGSVIAARGRVPGTTDQRGRYCLRVTGTGESAHAGAGARGDEGSRLLRAHDALGQAGIQDTGTEGSARDHSNPRRGRNEPRVLMVASRVVPDL